MEIEQLRQEINHLLESVSEHSNRYSNNKVMPSLEISVVLAKISKMQEKLSVLRYLLEQQENNTTSYNQQILIDKGLKQAEISIEEKELPPNITEVVESVQQEKHTLGDQLEHLPIAKLIDALTLNDRYLYANELFAKNMTAFNELVKSIDNSTSINEAKELLSQRNWDDENEHVLSFMNLVERRFL